MRNVCVAVVLFEAPWVLTGSIWGSICPSEQLQDLGLWRDEGYAARLELVDLTRPPFRILTHHLCRLQQLWRRRWQRRVHGWLRWRAFTGVRQPPVSSAAVGR